jgi:hypothetical protein
MGTDRETGRIGKHVELDNLTMIEVALTLVGTAAPCGDAPTRQGIQEG